MFEQGISANYNQQLVDLAAMLVTPERFGRMGVEVQLPVEE